MQELRCLIYGDGRMMIEEEFGSVLMESKTSSMVR